MFCSDKANFNVWCLKNNFEPKDLVLGILTYRWQKKEDIVKAFQKWLSTKECDMNDELAKKITSEVLIRLSVEKKAEYTQDGMWAKK